MKSVCLYSEIPEKYHKYFPKNRGGNDTTPPHVTVLYIGTVEDRDVPKLEQIVKTYASQAKEAHCKFGRYKRFPEGVYGIPHYIEVLGDHNLYKLHYDLWNILSHAGFSIDHDYKGSGYLPHATLQHLPSGHEYTGEVPQGTFTLNSIMIGVY